MSDTKELQVFQNEQDICPNCGYCPRCGRHRDSIPFIPWTPAPYPVSPAPYPVSPAPYPVSPAPYYPWWEPWPQPPIEPYYKITSSDDTLTGTYTDAGLFIS